MIFHENRLLADGSHVISYLIFVKNWERCQKDLSSAAIVIGTLRVKPNTIKNKAFILAASNEEQYPYILM